MTAATIANMTTILVNSTFSSLISKSTPGFIARLNAAYMTATIVTQAKLSLKDVILHGHEHRARLAPRVLPRHRPTRHEGLLAFARRLDGCGGQHLRAQPWSHELHYVSFRVDAHHPVLANHLLLV